MNSLICRNKFKMKRILSVILFSYFIFSNAQEEKIVELLNLQIQKEEKLYDEFDKKMPKLIQLFEIEDGVLSFEFLYDEPDQVVSMRREVVLDKIKNINKSGEVVFLTKETATKQIANMKSKINKDQSQYFILNSMFLTEIRKETDNKDFRDELLKAFRNAGYDVSSEFWMD